MKTAKKLTALLLVLTLLFALSATAFATSGTVYVKFYVPDSGIVTVPSGYTLEGEDANEVEWYAYSNSADLSTLTACPVTLPEGFQGASLGNNEYVATVFDAIYDVAVTQKHEVVGTDFVYGFDTYNTPNGIYVDKLSGIGTITESSTYDSSTGHGSWAGYSWNMYVVPSGGTFNPLDHDNTYLGSYYPNNIAAVSGATIYMILEHSSYTF